MSRSIRIALATVAVFATTMGAAPVSAQGNAQSDPDGGFVDKPDFNNGCGNEPDGESPRDDDNNGNCGGPKKTPEPAPSKTPEPTKSPTPVDLPTPPTHGPVVSPTPSVISVSPDAPTSNPTISPTFVAPPVLPTAVPTVAPEVDVVVPPAVVTPPKTVVTPGTPAPVSTGVPVGIENGQLPHTGNAGWLALAGAGLVLTGFITRRLGVRLDHV